MVLAEVFRAIQTAIALSGLVLISICCLALWQNRECYNSAGYMTLVGLSIKWFPAAMLYAYLAYANWTDPSFTIPYSVAPTWMRLFFHFGLLTGSAILISRFQSLIANRMRAFVLWTCLNAVLIIIMVALP